MEGASITEADNAHAKKLSPDLEMDSHEEVLNYAKAPGVATTRGLEFEWTIAALLFLRLLRSGLKFHLASNVQGAGKLDDIVVRFEEEPGQWKTLFVQLKHKETESLFWRMLTSKRPENKFSLLSFFKSYLEIKEAMTSDKRDTLFSGRFEDCVFVIFTNAKPAGKLGEKTVTASENCSQAEKFLWSGAGSVFNFEADEEMLKCLGEFGDDGVQFLKQLRLFCGQPSVNDLKAAIVEELTKLQPNMNIERLCECYLANVKTWWETSNEILHNAHDLLSSTLYNVRLESESTEDRVRLQTSSEQTQKAVVLPVEFEDTAALKIGNGLTHVVSSEFSCRLTLTKLLQATEDQFLVLSCKQLLDNKPALLAEFRNDDVKCLILFTKDWRAELCSEYFDVINRILANRDAFSVVLVSSGEIVELTERFKKDCYKDNFKISQLKMKFRDLFFNKIVNLQGHDISLRTLLNGDYKNLDHILTAPLVVEILESVDPLAVGSALAEGIGHYVERVLERPCVKPSVIQAVKGTITVRITLDVESDRCLFDKALDFVNSLKHSPSLNLGEKEDIVDQLARSPLVPHSRSGKVYSGPKLPLGFFECNCVGLRYGKENAVTALCVWPGNEGPQQDCYIFISSGTSEEDAIELSTFYNSKHLLSLKDNQLCWIQSDKHIESIRKHIDEDQVSRFAPETALDVEGRLVLVCAEPGMGKSTLMARLAKNTKAALPHYFVILIALNDHIKLFSEDKHVDALEFLSVAADMDSPFQLSLLKFALKVSGNVVVIADGFDEIAPKYVEQSCDLLSRLLAKTKASKIWMTSRNSVKQTLETNFSKFAVKICEFDKKGQNTFLQKFWQGKVSKKKLDKIIKQIKKSSQAIGEKESNFMGIPLQTQMLAEVYEDHVTSSAYKFKLPDKLDILSLVEKFVELKYDIYFRDKTQTANFDLHKETLLAMSRNDFFARHTNAALILILGDEEIKSLGLGWILTESSTFFSEINQGAYKTGFIDEIVNGEPRFTHRVYAEYLVANWLSRHFSGHLDLVISKMFIPEFTVIRHFFNGILCKGFALHTAVLQEKLEEVRTLLKRKGVDVDAKDVGGRTALHLAASLGASKDREENKRRCEILDLIISKSSDFKVVDKVLNGSPLRYADITRWWTAIDLLLYKTEDSGQAILTLENVKDDDMLDTIFKQDLVKLLGLCLDNGLEVDYTYNEWYMHKVRLLDQACKEGSVKVASLLIERDANIDTTNEYGPLSPLCAASYNGHLEIVKVIHKKYCFEYINANVKNGRTAMHHAAMGGHIDVINFLLNQGVDSKCLDTSDKTALHYAAESNKPSAVRVLLDVLSEADRVAVINSLCCEGYNVVHLAVRGGSVECLQLVLKAGGSLSKVGKGGETPLMVAARGGKREVVEWLFENFNSEREDMSLEKYMDMIDSDACNIMHYAAQSGSVECVKFLLEFDTRLPETSRQLHENTPLMIAAIKGKPEVVECMLKNFNTQREGCSLDTYINMMDREGKTALHYAARECAVSCAKILVRFGGKMSLADCNGETALMIAATKYNHVLVEWLLNEFNDEREGMSLKSFINMRSYSGQTARDISWSECLEVIDKFNPLF